MSVAGPQRGRVEGFDASAGLGTLVLDTGERVGFHATQLPDGERHVAVGSVLWAVVVPWHAGELEATALRHDAPEGSSAQEASSSLADAAPPSP